MSIIVFDTALQCYRLKACRSLVDDVIHTVIYSPRCPLVGTDPLYRLIGKLDTLRNIVAEQILITQMRALVVYGQPVRCPPLPEAEGKTDRVVGVDEFVRGRMKIELSMNSAAKVRLPICLCLFALA